MNWYVTVGNIMIKFGIFAIGFGTGALYTTSRLRKEYDEERKEERDEEHKELDTTFTEY
jgi:hypothetical protein